MSHENANQKPPPKPRLGRAMPTASGLKIVTVAPQSGTQHQTPPPPPPPRGGAPIGDRPLPEAQPDPYLGCTIDKRYKVEALLGEGGMGMVYRCRHKIIDKQVAMKILRADLARDREVTERFLIEAKAASSIGNDHIIDISDFGQLPDGSAYFVMEFLEGVPLSAAVPDGQRMSEERIIPIALQLCDGLAAAHAVSIVHRDLKPDNIYLVTRGSDADYVKILDFGIAKVSNNATGKLTQAGSVFGTPHYMSPEQAAGAPVDHRGDIYSIGVILYELASGKVPFDADNFMGILTQHMYKAPERLSTLGGTPAVSPGLEAVVLKCLSKRPEQRYQSMAALGEDLRRLRSGEIPVAVEELLARSGGFNVPANFFAPTPSDADESSIEVTFTRKRGRGWLWFALLVPIAAGVGVWLSQQPDVGGIARRLQNRVTQHPDNNKDVATPPAKLAAAEPSDEAPQARQVVVGIEPAEAHAYLDGTDLGVNPVLVDVPESKVVTLEIRHPNFKTETVTLDGTEPKLSVSLTPVARRKWRPAVRASQKSGKAGAPTTPATGNGESDSKNEGVGTGEIVNPWVE